MAPRIQRIGRSGGFLRGVWKSKSFGIPRWPWAARLNSQMFGPSMYPFVPEAALQGHSDPDKIWKPFDEREASRRAIYAFIKRSMVVPSV